MNLTGIVIVKNGEDLIVDCLKSLSFCDEILVIDNDSKDKTVKLSEELGARVVESKTTDFSEMRNRGLREAKGKWIIYVDVDERINEELKNEIIKAIKDDNYSFYIVERKNYYLGNHLWPKTEKMQRLFKKESLKGWFGRIHESPRTEGKSAVLDGYLLHFTHRNLSEMLAKTIEWSKIEAELRYESHHPKMSWWRFPRVMITTFFNYYFIQRGYKLGIAGLIESMYQSFSIFITYARLWEMQKK
ncbi:glycosyltransferase family 2 protein [Patescibacteria group bacterium]|nr:glycosyltransferase family 2 protein [Patescibacteria group bacterium]